MRLAHSATLIVLTATGWSTVATAQAPSVPTLRHAFTSNDVDRAPSTRLTPIAVGPQGHVLFVSNSEGSDKRMTLVDSTGKLVLRLGQPGAGPGEVRMPWPAEVTTQRLAVWDLGNTALLEWDLAGKFIGSVKPTGVSSVVSVTDRVVGMRSVQGVWQPVLIDRATAQLRELVPATDTFMSTRYGAVNGRSNARYAPVLGRWSEGFVVADPMAYALALYRWDGQLVRVLRRDVAPERASEVRIDEFIATMTRQMAERGQPPVGAEQLAAMRKQALEQVFPPITPGSPLRTDARNRTWVLGMSGDSAFADVFAPDRFLGRIPVPCRLFNGMWGLSGNWLAVACLPDTEAFDGDAVIKLFRIVDRGR